MKIFECLDCFKNSYSAASLEMQKDPSCPYCKGTEIREVDDLDGPRPKTVGLVAGDTWLEKEKADD